MRRQMLLERELVIWRGNDGEVESLAGYFGTEKQRHFESNFLKDAEVYETLRVRV